MLIKESQLFGYMKLNTLIFQKIEIEHTDVSKIEPTIWLYEIIYVSNFIISVMFVFELIGIVKVRLLFVILYLKSRFEIYNSFCG